MKVRFHRVLYQKKGETWLISPPSIPEFHDFDWSILVPPAILDLIPIAEPLLQTLPNDVLGEEYWGCHFIYPGHTPIRQQVLFCTRHEISQLSDLNCLRKAGEISGSFSSDFSPKLIEVPCDRYRIGDEKEWGEIDQELIGQQLYNWFWRKSVSPFSDQKNWWLAVRLAWMFQVPEHRSEISFFWSLPGIFTEATSHPSFIWMPTGLSAFQFQVEVLNPVRPDLAALLFEFLTFQLETLNSELADAELNGTDSIEQALKRAFQKSFPPDLSTKIQDRFHCLYMAMGHQPPLYGAGDSVPSDVIREILEGIPRVTPEIVRGITRFRRHPQGLESILTGLEGEIRSVALQIRENRKQHVPDWLTYKPFWPTWWLRHLFKIMEAIEQEEPEAGLGLFVAIFKEGADFYSEWKVYSVEFMGDDLSKWESLWEAGAFAPFVWEEFRQIVESAEVHLFLLLKVIRFPIELFRKQRTRFPDWDGNGDLGRYISQFRPEAWQSVISFAQKNGSKFWVDLAVEACMIFPELRRQGKIRSPYWLVIWRRLIDAGQAPWMYVKSDPEGVIDLLYRDLLRKRRFQQITDLITSIAENAPYTSPWVLNIDPWKSFLPPEVFQRGIRSIAEGIIIEYQVNGRLPYTPSPQLADSILTWLRGGNLPFTLRINTISGIFAGLWQYGLQEEWLIEVLQNSRFQPNLFDQNILGDMLLQFNWKIAAEWVFDHTDWQETHFHVRELLPPSKQVHDSTHHTESIVPQDKESFENEFYRLSKKIMEFSPEDDRRSLGAKLKTVFKQGDKANFSKYIKTLRKRNEKFNQGDPKMAMQLDYFESQYESINRKMEIKIVHFLVTPVGLSHLPLKKEATEMQNILARTLGKGEYELWQFRQPEVGDFQSEVISKPATIVHFSGHGDTDANGQEGGIFLVNEFEEAVWIEPSFFADFFRMVKEKYNPSLRVVILNGCYSGVGEQTKAISESGLYVIGMLRGILNDVATKFSELFYTHLAHPSSNMTVENAFELACNGIGMGPHSKSADIPVLWKDGVRISTFS